MSEKVASSAPVSTLFASSLALGRAAGEHAAALAALDRTASAPAASPVYAMDEDCRPLIEAKIFGDVVLADAGAKPSSASHRLRSIRPATHVKLSVSMA